MDIEKLSKLTKLKEEDVFLHKKELSLILDAFKQINKVDSKDISPTSVSLELYDKYRNDNIEDVPDRDSLLENAPELAGRSFKVPFKL